ncbi:Gfo/Idh/MocA family oxidoreductase [Lentzea sp. PSKA42]|uniref:Gfo/Idh/MocA family oxidoreductase n=1 Tax=Lentzea indica TaxID=2604800 RepID=A0ABX1FL84_9PSEU|nr:Gfo/Idh/MocA family oxidoreductase [Lentzea indica]
MVGRGWRADFYLRLARELAHDVVGVVTRSPERGHEVERAWDVPTYRSVAKLLAATEPRFVVTSVAKSANPDVIRELVDRGTPVLAETPPAPTLDSLRELWATAGESGLVQVAEQYPFQPMHMARQELVRRGLIGTPTSVEVSSTHDYHAVALIRGLLGVGFSPIEVAGRRFTSQLLRGPDRSGWPSADELVETQQTVATLDFGSGRMGLYDFTYNQWWHPLRTHRHVVRGTHGEIVDDRVMRMADVRSPVLSRIERRQAGVDSNLEGFALDTLSVDAGVLWRNPYFPKRLSDEEIAIATCLDRMAAWTQHDGPAPYPLAEACQDQLIALAIAQACDTGQPVTTTEEAWAA